MEETNVAYHSLQNMINTLKVFLNFFFKKWWLLLLIMLIGAGVGTMYYFMQKPKYEAMTTFILEEKSSGSNGLAGLASQFGFNVGSFSGGGMFSGDNILTILRSKKIVEEVLLSKVDSSSSNGVTLADYFLQFTGMQKSWQKKPALAGISFSNLKTPITPLQDSVLDVIYRVIIKNNLTTDRLSKQSSIISVRVIASDAIFARLMSERLVDEAARLYMEIRTGAAEKNIQQLQKRSDSLLLLLNGKFYSTAASQPLDANPGIRTAVVPAEIAARDKTVLATLYAEIVKNLEASKLILSQQTPVMQRLDKPGYLLQDKRKGLVFLAVVPSFIFGFLYFAAFAVLFLYFGMGANSQSVRVRSTSKDKTLQMTS